MKKIAIKLLAFYKRRVNEYHIKRLFRYDCKYALKMYRGTCSPCIDKLDADIMLIMHALEKGLSFPNKKREFGKDKSLELMKMLQEHIDKYGINKQVISGTNILNEYIHDDFSVSDKNIRDNILLYLDNNKHLIQPNYGGIKYVQKPSTCISYESLLHFAQQRVSVRTYSQDPISDDEIQKAIRFAETSPSACNRQSSRTYVIRDKGIMEKILANQLGDQGWCNTANVLFIITSVATYFGNQYERQEPYIDGGMYAMNLVMGLHAQSIASCFKMYVRSPELDNEFRAIVGIPENEIPIVLLFSGHYCNDICKSPISKRYEQNYEIQ